METSSALLRTFRGILSVKQSEVRPHLHRTGNLKSRIDRRCATGLAIMALTPRKRTFNSQHGKRLPFTQRQGHNGLDLELQHQNYSVRQEMGYINPLNPELNLICYLLALLGAHHFLHVSSIRVKLLTFRRLMS